MELLKQILQFMIDYKEAFLLIGATIAGIFGLYFKFRGANTRDNELKYQKKKELLELLAESYTLKKELLANYAALRYGGLDDVLKNFEQNKSKLKAIILHDYSDMYPEFEKYIDFQMKWVNMRSGGMTVDVPKNLRKFEKIHEDFLKNIKAMENK